MSDDLQTNALVARRAAAAEQRIASVRVVVALSGAALYPWVATEVATMPRLAYALLAGAIFYSIYVLAAKPYLRRPGLASSLPLSLADGGITLLWLYATGGYDSPFFIALYPAIIAIAFRFPTGTTMAAAALYGGGYALLVAATGGLDGHAASLATRVVYVGLAGALGHAMARLVHETLRVQQEAAARERAAESRFRLGLEAAPAGILMADAGGHIVLANEAFERLVGARRGELRGRSVDDFVPADQRQHHADLRQRYPSHPAPRPMGARRDLFVRRLDGREVPAEIGLTPVQSDEGLMILASVLDISERKRTEAHLQHALEELEQRNRDLTQFARVVAHDLKEPLATSRGFVELLVHRGGELPAQFRDYLDRALGAMDRLWAMIDGLLTYARIEGPGPALQPVDLNGVMRDVLAHLEREIADSGAAIRTEPLPTVPGDATLLQLVLLNLIGNAIKYRGDRAPVVEVTASIDDDQVVLQVRDNGQGIAPEQAERIFDLFYRSPGQRSVPGSGLGLATCKRVVEQFLGGRIWVQSRPGQGSAFFVALPSRAWADMDEERREGAA